MSLTDFYLLCFLVGFLLSVASLLLGHLHVHVHLPHGDLHVPHVHVGHHGGVHADNGHSVISEAQVSPVNFATITAFLAWFGGAGYLLTRYGSFWYMFALAVALAFGAAGAWIVLCILRKLITREENLDPADYDMVGVLGRVVSPIRAGGTGEIVYVQGGTRHASGARSEDGSAISREEEVVVTRYENGIAYVRRWDEMTTAAEGVSAQL